MLPRRHSLFGVWVLALGVLPAVVTPALAQPRLPVGIAGRPVGVGIPPITPNFVRPGASFQPYANGYGLGVGAPRFSFGYANGNFALGIGIGNALGYRGYYGSSAYYGYPGPVVAVPYYVPYYVPVPTNPYGELTGPTGPPPAYYPPPANNLPDPAPVTKYGTARITIQVPPNARVWVDDMPTSQTGAVREFVTPPSLDIGKTYKYTFRAQWEENGQQVTRERTVELQSGSAVIVNFTVDTKQSGL